jgi:hypothetical protein
LNSDFTNKKMKRLTFILLVLVLLLSSCTQEQAPQSGVCDVMLEIVQEKNITATQMDVISYYRYDAHITGGSVSTEGQATNEILVVKDGLANIGSLAQGLWTITVRAYSLRNTVLYEGSVSLYVGSSAFTARIVLSQHTGIDGHVSIDIMTIKTAEENPALLAEWASLDGQVSDLWSVWTTESGSPDPEHVRFSGVLAIPEGRYNLTLSLYGNTKLSCSVTDLMVVGNDTTYVSGYLNPGTDVQGYIFVDGPAKLAGAIESSGSPVVGAEITYSWINTGRPVSSYSWSVNGQTQSSTTSSMKYTIQTPGIYTISCVVKNADGESASTMFMANASLPGWQELGSAILHDYGTNYGTYSLSQDKTMALRLSGTGGRYLGFAGTLEGKGTVTEPNILWAPYIQGNNKTDALGTSASSGKANTRIITAADSTMAPHTYNGAQCISLGGAYKRYGDETAHIPSKDEMNYVCDAVNSGKIVLENGTVWWTSTEDGELAWAMVVSGGRGVLTKISKTAMAGVIFVRLV